MPGQPVADTVTSGVAGASDHWVPGLELNATGWYFDRIDPDALDGAISPEQGQSAEAFLDDLASRGYKPAGYGEAVFDGPRSACDRAGAHRGRPNLIWHRSTAGSAPGCGRSSVAGRANRHGNT